MILSSQLKKLHKDVNKYIHYINSGGCGYFAKFLSQRLTYLNIKHSIVFLDRLNPVTLSYNKFNGIYHVMILIPKVGYIDGEKVIKNSKKINYAYRKTGVPFRKLSNFVDMREYWNDMYDTSQNYLLKTLIDDNIR